MANEINKRIQDLDKALDPAKLAKEAHAYFKSITPIDSGNARRNTKLANDEIQARYAYAKRLDEGYSDQAPNGMSKPTDKFIQEYIKKQVK